MLPRSCSCSTRGSPQPILAACCLSRARRSNHIRRWRSSAHSAPRFHVPNRSRWVACRSRRSPHMRRFLAPFVWALRDLALKGSRPSGEPGNARAPGAARRQVGGFGFRDSGCCFFDPRLAFVGAMVPIAVGKARHRMRRGSHCDSFEPALARCCLPAPCATTEAPCATSPRSCRRRRRSPAGARSRARKRPRDPGST